MHCLTHQLVEWQFSKHRAIINPPATTDSVRQTALCPEPPADRGDLDAKARRVRIEQFDILWRWC